MRPLKTQSWNILLCLEMLPELNSLFEPVVITSNRKWAMKPFPKAPYLTKAYNWLRWAGGVKLCWLREHLQTLQGRKENETTQVQMESLFACFCPAALCVPPCLLQSRRLGAAVLLQPLIMPVLVLFRVAADCSVCSAVIWTPFCCWRASTTSAPCCCGVRGRTSLSSTTRGMEKKKTKLYVWQYVDITHCKISFSSVIMSYELFAVFEQIGIKNKMYNLNYIKMT